MDTMKVNIDSATNTITVWNNGGGIPVQMHTTENCWLPELIFGHLLTSRFAFVSVYTHRCMHTHVNSIANTHAHSSSLVISFFYVCSLFCVTHTYIHLHMHTHTIIYS